MDIEVTLSYETMTTLEQSIRTKKKGMVFLHIYFPTAGMYGIPNITWLTNYQWPDVKFNELKFVSVDSTTYAVLWLKTFLSYSQYKYMTINLEK